MSLLFQPRPGYEIYSDTGEITSYFGALADHVDTLDKEYWDDMQSRYDLIHGKTPAELAAMGITLEGSSYFKNGEAWLTENAIDKITDRYAPLMDEYGNYKYALDIPESIMLSVVQQYGTTLTKEELEKIARDTYAAIGRQQYDALLAGDRSIADSAIKQSVSGVVDEHKNTNTELAASLTAADSSVPSFFKKNKTVIIIAAVAVVGLIVVSKIFK